MKPLKNPNLVVNKQSDKILIHAAGKIILFREHEMAVWELCDGEHTIDQIIEKIIKENPEVPVEVIQSEMENFLSNLVQRELIYYA